MPERKFFTLRVSPPAHPKTIARRVALMKDVQQNAVKECNTSVLPPMCSHCSPARCTQYRTRRAQHVPDMWTHWERGRGGRRGGGGANRTRMGLGVSLPRLRPN